MLPELLPIRPRGAVSARLRVPGSKSYSNRALLIAGLARGPSELSGVLDCDDTRVMERALRAFGAELSIEADRWSVRGVAGRPRAVDGVIDVRASGTAARFLTAAAALAPGATIIDGSERMRQRPIAELTRALEALGVQAQVLGKDGCPPVRIEGGRPFGGEVHVDASRSSQYVSALLLIAPYAARATQVVLQGGVLVSRPYVELTLEAMRHFGARVAWQGEDRLAVEPGTGYGGCPYTVEADASTAAYFFVAAAISGGQVTVEGLGAHSTQADVGLLGVLEQMGCRVRRLETATEVQGPERLRAVDVDMNAMPDAVLALAVCTLFADGESRIRNVANLRIKETDRLAALEAELRKLGAEAHADRDSLRVRPGTLRGASIATYDDHRMAMAFALAGLRVPGVVIEHPSCVSKSWPGYFEAFEKL
jgi:3-phosphoshikimate 1-carboxyvinyltransferase